MTEPLSVSFAGETLHLLPEKAIWWEAEQALLLSDLHLGKVGHFRKNGIALSSKASGEELVRLNELIVRYHPQSIYILGDLFHSELNAEWQDWIAFRKSHAAVDFALVPGNHDILQKEDYAKAEMKVLDEQFKIRQVVLTHDMSERINKKLSYLHGHLHPGVSLSGKGRQRLRLPAFYLEENRLLLPAFGKLTGLHQPRMKARHQVFAISGTEVLAIQPNKRA